MNPYMISTVVGTIVGLKRTCPKCRKNQVVPPGKRKETVTCKYCGASIPPRK